MLFILIRTTWSKKSKKLGKIEQIYEIICFLRLRMNIQEYFTLKNSVISTLNFSCYAKEKISQLVSFQASKEI